MKRKYGRTAPFFWARIGGHFERVHIGGDGQLWYWDGFDGQRTLANKDQALAWATKHGENIQGLLKPRLQEMQWSEGHRLGARRLSRSPGYQVGRGER